MLNKVNCRYSHRKIAMTRAVLAATAQPLCAVSGGKELLSSALHCNIYAFIKWAGKGISDQELKRFRGNPMTREKKQNKASRMAICEAFLLLSSFTLTSIID